MYTIAQAKDDLIGVLHSTSIDKVKVSNSLFARAGRQVLSRVDPRETKRIQNLSNALHDDIYDYAAPSDYKKPIDLRPQINRDVSNSFTHVGSKEFDKFKRGLGGKHRIQERFDDGILSLRIAEVISPAPILITEADSLTGWSVGGGAENLTLDQLYKVSGIGSLNFDLIAASSPAYIENSSLPVIDLTTHDEKSSLFVRVYIPDPSIITSYTLRWGNSSLLYWSNTVTAAHDATAFREGFNILRFDWNGAVETGAVDPSTIDYIRLTVNYNGTADTDLRLDKITSSLGSIYELEYYSKFIFRSSAGVWKETTDSDDDIINLDTEAYNLFLFQTAEYAVQQMQGKNMSTDLKFFAEELNGDGTDKKPGAYKTYRKNYPSEALKQLGYWSKTRRFTHARRL